MSLQMVLCRNANVCQIVVFIICRCPAFFFFDFAYILNYSSYVMDSLKQTDLTNKSSEDLVSATSPVIKQITIKTSGSIDSSLHYPGGLGSTTNLPKNDFRCSSNDGTVVSCHNVVSKTDEQPVSQQLRACSGDSQVTSSKSSDLNRGADEIMEHRSHSNSLDLSLPPPGIESFFCHLHCVLQSTSI